MDERTLNDLLECSVCLERLDTTSKVLPCQHTFCRKCLEVIVLSHSELRCPECRVLVDIKIDDLPPNVLLMRILEGLKNAISPPPSILQTNYTTEAVSLPNLKPIQTLTNPSAYNANGSCNNDHGIGVDISSRDQVKRTVPSNSDQIHRTETRAMTKSNDETLNPIRTNLPGRQPLQNVPTSTLNSNSLQSTGSNLAIPHAKALYDFLDSKEPGDLSFKKGEKIFLRRRIDMNWFIGETANGREGVFPINYVQIIVPLAQPQCKALYDFRMGPNEEEGCLTFKKGAIIQVIRRVDQNWAEGRIDDTIGIFPIAFVEMNSLAKHIMDASPKYIHYAMTQRNVPPTPNEQQQQQQQQHNSFSSGSSSLTTSPVSPNSSSTSTSSSGANTVTQKNHQTLSQNVALLSSGSSSVTNKRDSSNASNTNNASNLNATNGAGQHPNRNSKDMQTGDKSKVPAQKLPKTGSSMNKTGSSSSNSNSNNNSKANQRQRQSAHAINVPSNAFVALYSYKRQKSDELELKKGSIYYVKERCQDGWYRGVNRAQKSGVFPGNYVAPLRNFNETSNGSASSGASSIGQITHSKRSGACISNAQLNTTVSGKSGYMNPPELPPRSSGSSTSTSSSSSVWSKPIGQHVEALFGRSQSSSTVNLIKRITNIKRSKSPVNQSSPAYSMDNPVFEDNTIGCTDTPKNVPTSTTSKRNTIHLSHPQHVRSGSCPSQLLQNLPVDIDQNTSAGTSAMFGSQRIKSHKERAALHQMTHGLAIAHQVKNADTSSPYHRKSQSLDAATIAAQLLNGTSDGANANKRKSYTHNEKFKCIVSYPPNSDFELELSVGDIVYVHKKRDNGWYKGTHAQTGKVGLFPSSFVEPII